MGTFRTDWGKKSGENIGKLGICVHLGEKWVWETIEKRLCCKNLWTIMFARIFGVSDWLGEELSTVLAAEVPLIARVWLTVQFSFHPTRPVPTEIQSEDG